MKDISMIFFGSSPPLDGPGMSGQAAQSEAAKIFASLFASAIQTSKSNPKASSSGKSQGESIVQGIHDFLAQNSERLLELLTGTASTNVSGASHDSATATASPPVKTQSVSVNKNLQGENVMKNDQKQVRLKRTSVLQPQSADGNSCQQTPGLLFSFSENNSGIPVQFLTGTENGKSATLQSVLSQKGIFSDLIATEHSGLLKSPVSSSSITSNDSSANGKPIGEEQKNVTTISVGPTNGNTSQNNKEDAKTVPTIKNADFISEMTSILLDSDGKQEGSTELTTETKEGEEKPTTTVNLKTSTNQLVKPIVSEVQQKQISDLASVGVDDAGKSGSLKVESEDTSPSTQETQEIEKESKGIVSERSLDALRKLLIREGVEVDDIEVTKPTESQSAQPVSEGRPSIFNEARSMLEALRQQVASERSVLSVTSSGNIQEDNSTSVQQEAGKNITATTEKGKPELTSTNTLSNDEVQAVPNQDIKKVSLPRIAEESSVDGFSAAQLKNISVKEQMNISNPSVDTQESKQVVNTPILEKTTVEEPKSDSQVNVVNRVSLSVPITSSKSKDSNQQNDTIFISKSALQDLENILFGEKTVSLKGQTEKKPEATIPQSDQPITQKVDTALTKAESNAVPQINSTENKNTVTNVPQSDQPITQKVDTVLSKTESNTVPQINSTENKNTVTVIPQSDQPMTQKVDTVLTKTESNTVPQINSTENKNTVTVIPQSDQPMTQKVDTVLAKTESNTVLQINSTENKNTVTVIPQSDQPMTQKVDTVTAKVELNAIAQTNSTENKNTVMTIPQSDQPMTQKVDTVLTKTESNAVPQTNSTDNKNTVTIIPQSDESITLKVDTVSAKVELNAIAQTNSADSKDSSLMQRDSQSDKPQTQTAEQTVHQTAETVLAKEVKNKFASLIHEISQQQDVRVITIDGKTTISSGDRVIDSQKFIETLAKETTTSLRNGVTDMRVQLEPENLGKMTLHFSSDEGHVGVRIEVTNSDIKQVVDLNMPRLRDEMQQRGISLDRVDVFVAGDSLPKNKREQNMAQQKSGTTIINHVDNKDDEGDIAKPRNLGYNTIEYLM